jgi:hypothetical protein
MPTSVRTNFYVAQAGATARVTAKQLTTNIDFFITVLLQTPVSLQWGVQAH